MDKKKITLIVLLLIVCFFIGFSIPYIYNNYSFLLKNHVMSNGKEEIENGSSDLIVKEENKKEQREEPKEEIDYNKVLKEAENSFYNGNYEQSINKYIKLYDLGYDNLEILKN